MFPLVSFDNQYSQGVVSHATPLKTILTQIKINETNYMVKFEKINSF